MAKDRKRGCLFRIIRGIVLVLLLAALTFYLMIALPLWGIPFNGQRHTAPPLTPPWALECWVWEDDENTAEFTLELLDGYKEHDFPVRTVLIDSPWSTRYNDFIVDKKRFPEPAEFFKKLQDDGYRVVLWTTNNVNSVSKDTAIPKDQDWYQTAAQKGYIVGGDHQINWWKGRGGFIDYSNPEAMKWWRGLQQQVLDWGVDGWKLDGTATLFRQEIGPVPIPFRRKSIRIPVPYLRAHKGLMTLRGYMDHYYRDEYQHGLTVNPEFITLARAIDSPTPWAHPEGFAPLDAAPVAWVGDNRHTWEDEERGLQRAISCILKSAELGYCVIGSDVAGYHGKTPIPPRVYIRWAQFSTFCGLFLNGGHGERRMWKRSQMELDIIRQFSWLHTELVPYMYSYVVTCHKGGRPLMQALESEDPYDYLFGDDFFVAPIVEDSLQRTVSLPKGRWRYFFDDAEVIEGPATITREFGLREFPVYIRDGAIVPMRIEREYTGIGEREWEDFLTFNIYPAGTNAFETHHTDGSGSTRVEVIEGNPLKVTVEGAKVPHILRILAKAKPASVMRDGKELAEGLEWFYKEAKQRLAIRTQDYGEGTYAIRW